MMIRRPVRKSGRNAVGRPRKLEVAVGRYYQISHDKLPPKTPFWLKFIKIVTVSDKNRLKFTVRFPSMKSLQVAGETGSSPVLDMWFSMGTEIAVKVLKQEVASPDFDNVDDFKAYWLLDPSSLAPKLELEEVSPKYLRWPTIPCKEEQIDEVESKELQEVESKELQVVEVKEENVDGYTVGEDIQKKKKRKWWSDQSFETGRNILLNILKEKSITADKPIYRAALRKEAQKQIGNTGLLDHLLKDLPGKIAPDGVSRFQRCYNADGVIMYWLESADLVDIRQKAGVADPFWIPPPGWKMGACTTGCPCSKELELLKEDVEKIKRELEDTKKQLHEVRAGDNRSNGRCSEITNWVGGYW